MVGFTFFSPPHKGDLVNDVLPPLLPHQPQVNSILPLVRPLSLFLPAKTSRHHPRRRNKVRFPPILSTERRHRCQYDKFAVFPACLVSILVVPFAVREILHRRAVVLSQTLRLPHCRIPLARRQPLPLPMVVVVSAADSPAGKVHFFRKWLHI